MFETSKDILNLVLALSVAGFTFFLCWFLFTITSGLKKAFRVVDEIAKLIDAIKEKVERAEKIFSAIEEKLKSMTSMLPLVMTGINKIIDFVKSKNEKKRSRKNSSRSDD